MGYDEYQNRVQEYYRNTTLILIFGLAIIGFVILNPLNFTGTNKSIFLSLGAAISASGVTKYIQRDSILGRIRREEVREIAEEWKLLGIQEGRGRAEKERYRGRLLESENEIHIQAISLSRFRQDLEDEIAYADAREVEIKLLLLNPSSEICNRYAELSETRQNLPDVIRDSTQKFEEMDLNNLEIRYYNDIPVNYFRVDNEAFVGPYFGRRRSGSTITFLGELSGEMVEQFEENFNDCWESAEPV